MLEIAAMTLRSLKRRVAVLIDGIEDDYQVGVARGVASASAHANTELVCIAGGVLDDTGSDEKSQRNFVYDLLENNRFDGVIALSGALGSRVGTERYAEWTKRFDGTPLVNLGILAQGSHSIEVDGAPGMREVVEHLVTAHGHRRIAFVAGPAASHEAQERYTAYCSVLAAHGIELDPKLVFEGNWLPEAGAAAARELFDQRSRSSEAATAIVCADDSMALGALEALRERGVAVPADVAVTGFDDVDSIRGVVPPLTTVRQPLDALGRDGFRRLTALMNGEEQPLTGKMVAQMVVRRSCGCSSVGSALSSRREKAGGRSFESALMERRSLLCAELARSAHGTLFGAGPDWEERLVAALTRDLVQKEATSFVSALERLISNLQRTKRDLSACQSVLGVLRRGILDCAAGDPERLALANDICDVARELVGASLVRGEIVRQVELSHQLRDSFRLASVLFGSTDANLLRRDLEERFRGLGIPTLSVGLFTEPGRVTEQCVCVAAYSGVGRVETAPTFPSSELAPAGIFDGTKEALLVQPLVFDGQPIGLLTMSFLADVELYDRLREILASGLQGYRLAAQARTER